MINQRPKSNFRDTAKYIEYLISIHLDGAKHSLSCLNNKDLKFRYINTFSIFMRLGRHNDRHSFPPGSELVEIINTVDSLGVSWRNIFRKEINVESMPLLIEFTKETISILEKSLATVKKLDPETHKSPGDNK